MNEPSIIKGNHLDLRLLERLARRPPAFSESDVTFWDDPYVSGHVLNAHLDPDDDEATRRPETVEAAVDWIDSRIRRARSSTVSSEGSSDRESTGCRILDLGCGPGLYAMPLAARGYRVTGVDISANSIAYARKASRRRGLKAAFHVGNYLDATLGGPYDAVLLVYGGLSELAPDRRDTLLRRIRDVLLPGGVFIFDVVTRRHAQRLGEKEGWYVSGKGGFWAKGYHMVLEQCLHYPEVEAHLQRFIIIHRDGSLRTVPLWRSYYGPERLGTVLQNQGLRLMETHGDLTGRRRDPSSEWLGAVATGAEKDDRT